MYKYKEIKNFGFFVKESKKFLFFLCYKIITNLLYHKHIKIVILFLKYKNI